MLLYRPYCTGLKMELPAVDKIQNPYKPSKSINTGCISAYEYWKAKSHEPACMIFCSLQAMSRQVETWYMHILEKSFGEKASAEKIQVNM